MRPTDNRILAGGNPDNNPSALMSDDRLASLLDRLVGVRPDLVKWLMVAVEREPDRRIPDWLPLLADVQGAIAALEAVKTGSPAAI